MGTRNPASIDAGPDGSIFSGTYFVIQSAFNNAGFIAKQQSMTNEKFSLRARANSFGYAFKGIRNLLRYEHNAIIHLAATVVIIILGVWLELQRWEWVAIVMAMGFVWVTEILNTCVERIMDFISTEKHPTIGVIKDLAAAAVLIAAFSAIVVGAIIFIPKIIALL